MSDISANDDIPSGFRLRHILRGHTETINRITWSPDGRMLASSSRDFTIRLWDPVTGQVCQTLKGGLDHNIAWSPDGQTLASGAIASLTLWNRETGKPLRTLAIDSRWILSLLWSPDGRTLASVFKDHTIQLRDTETGKLLRSLTGHSDEIHTIAWSPDGQTLASGSDDYTIRLWNVESGALLNVFTGHTNTIHTIAWSPDGRTLASGSGDQTIRLWDPETGRQMAIFEGHTAAVFCISFSSDGHLLASKSLDGTVRLWHPHTWKMLAVLNDHLSYVWNKRDTGLAFQPNQSVLATFGEGNRTIRIWDLDLITLLGIVASTPSVYYTSAKVALVGDTGVGKTGLGLVLTNQQFVPTDSSHGRNVWFINNEETDLDDGRKEIHEMFLWDLAGQPGYRLIHQLHLNEVAIALVVFDACSETDPFKGVYYWDHALRQVQHLHGSRASAMKKLLVAARIDRGGIRASRARIELLVRELGFAGYFETSAKEGWGIVELTKAIKETADWVILPKVTSTDLFLHIKNFLTTEKHTGRLLTTVEDLYHAFLRIEQALTESDELQVQFDTCLGRLESQDLIRRLSFGNLVLLQPELLDAYASALVNTVKDEPDGMGYIAEERVRRGEFAIPGDERIADRNHESLLLIAMVEDLLHHEIALREYADDGPYLIFPAQSVRERPDLPDPEGKAVIFDFEGPVLNIYATLAVRLSHSGVFRRKEIWKDAMTYTTWMGGIYGMFLRNIDEGRGELVLFFDKEASEETRFHFEKYIQVHLERWALPESIKRQRILSFICSTCGEAFTESQVEHRRGLGFKWMRCSVCDSQVSLPTEDQRVSLVPKMDHAADVQRAREVTTSILQGRREIGDFDVFLCYNSQDRLKVKEIAEQLKAHGILPWLDEWELRPGLPWQRPLEQQIAKIKSAAVFVGRTGVGGKNVVGPWQQQELEAFLREFVKRGCPVIPVLLTNARRKPSLPIFLQGMTWVDFQQPDPDPMEQLLWGITGKNYDELLL